MQIGMTFEQCLTLRKQEVRFPMKLADAAKHLRLRGYACQPEMLDVLVEHGTITLAKSDAWFREHVEAAAEYFEQCELFTPYAAMCQAFICRYADFVEALLVAAEQESREYGRHVPADDQYFVMHRTPARGLLDENGGLTGITPAIITFTLCDDVRQRLECGLDV